MTLTKREAWMAKYVLARKVRLRLTRSEELNREHLPNLNVRGAFPDISDKDWNDLVHLLAIAVEEQPFGDPYLWQGHERTSFARWLRSWKV